MKAFDPAVVAATRLPKAEYPRSAPFHPHVGYPEYAGEVGTERNLVYEAVRESLRLLGMDGDNYGSPQWNPLGQIVRPGDRVVIKPNLLAHAHALRPDEWVQVITHGSVVRAVLDYVLLALKGTGQITVMDGPQYDSDWNQIIARAGIGEVVNYCAASTTVPIRLLDLRDYHQEVRGEVIFNRTALPSDPLGGVEIDLGRHSAFDGHGGSGRYFGSDYDQGETNRHHSNGRHEYRISRTAAKADVFINIPKLKTHKKVGVTLCMKNLVGINVGRNWLPHHTDGDPSSGGDQFRKSSLKSRLEKTIVRFLQQQSLHLGGAHHLFRLAKKGAAPIFGRTDQIVRSGNWHGNDTCWRMVLDINRCLMYGDGQTFPVQSAKRFFAVVDGVIGGDGDGPARPDAYPAGTILAGWNPVAVDCCATRLMGFDPDRVAYLAAAFEPHPFTLTDFSQESIRLRSNETAWNGSLADIPADSTLHFRPHFGWVGHLEYARGSETQRQPESACGSNRDANSSFVNSTTSGSNAISGIHR
ncbi:MAG TPA: DUF362 domain-containing protein [Candidatus Sulfotelmatobacter sp.]|nr:DUF362 domain-containing protein [Candidatus Sulfotelmatobacter sp.]